METLLHEQLQETERTEGSSCHLTVGSLRNPQGGDLGRGLVTTREHPHIFCHKESDMRKKYRKIERQRRLLIAVLISK